MSDNIFFIIFGRLALLYVKPIYKRLRRLKPKKGKMIKKLQKLARIEFSEEEAKIIEEDLGQMLKFIEKINEIDTTKVLPLVHISDNVNNLRMDEVKPLISRDEAMLNAPKANEAFFRVPKVLNK